LLFSLRDQVVEMARKATYVWKGMTLVMRLVKEVMVKSVIKVKFFTISEKEIRTVAEAQGVKVTEVRELRTGS
jgi:hypothetical protein